MLGSNRLSSRTLHSVRHDVSPHPRLSAPPSSPSFALLPHSVRPSDPHGTHSKWISQLRVLPRVMNHLAEAQNLLCRGNPSQQSVRRSLAFSIIAAWAHSQASYSDVRGPLNAAEIAGAIQNEHCDI